MFWHHLTKRARRGRAHQHSGIFISKWDWKTNAANLNWNSDSILLIHFESAWPVVAAWIMPRVVLQHCGHMEKLYCCTFIVANHPKLHNRGWHFCRFTNISWYLQYFIMLKAWWMKLHLYFNQRVSVEDGKLRLCYITITFAFEWHCNLNENLFTATWLPLAQTGHHFLYQWKGFLNELSGTQWLDHSLKMYWNDNVGKHWTCSTLALIQCTVLIRGSLTRTNVVRGP